MNNENMFLITDIEGYTPLISTLVSMLNYIRYGTISSVSELSTKQLDHLHDENSNSIAMLLQHMAMVEKAYQLITFIGKNEEDDAEFASLHPGLDLDERSFEIKDKPAEHYINIFE